MDIHISPHTPHRAQERGTDADEIKDVILHGRSVPVGQGRLCRARVYPYQQHRLGRYYEQKRVEVVYVMEAGTAVTVTVYVFCGQWESDDADPVQQPD